MSKPAAKPLPVVYFRCTRLNARMSVSSCVGQYNAANGHGDQHGMRFVQKANRSQCVGCPIGKAHHKGKPTPPELVTEPPRLHVVPDQPLKQRVCRECLMPFTPASTTQLLCRPGCSTRVTKPATPPPAPYEPEVTSRAHQDAPVVTETTEPDQELPAARRCEHCGGPIPADKSHAALTCSDNCYRERKLALERKRYTGTQQPGYKPRACVGCGDEFTPTANANRYCPTCKAGGAHPKTAPHNQPLVRSDRQTETTEPNASSISAAEPQKTECSETVRPDDAPNAAPAQIKPSTEPTYAAPEDVWRACGFAVVGGYNVPAGRLVVRAWNAFHGGGVNVLKEAGWNVVASGECAGHCWAVVARAA